MAMISLFRGSLKANRWLLFVIALALFIRVLYLIYYNNMQDWNQLTVDNYYHHHWAQSIAGGNIFGDTTYFRAPFYVFCLAFLYAIFGVSLWVGRLFGLVIGLVSVAMTYFIGKKFFNRQIGLTAALLQSVYPVMIYFEGELLLDPLFTLLLQFSIYRLLVWFENKTYRNALVTGLLIGLSSITRPTALIFIPLIILLLAASLKKADLWVKHSIVFILGTSLLIAPIFVRNFVIAGDPVPVASQAGINLYIGNNNNADGVSAVLPEPLGHNWRLKDITYLAEQDTGKRMKPGEVSSYWRNKALSWISTNPGKFISLYIKKLYYSFSNREISNNRNLDIFFNNVPILKYNPLSFGILFMLALVGIFAGFRRHRHVRLLTLIIIIYVLATSLFFFNSRFRLPLLPYYLLLAAFGFSCLIDQLRSHRRAISPYVFGITVAALFSFYPFFPLPRGASPLALTSKGLYYYEKGDIHHAIHYHHLALSIDSTFPETNLNLGVCYFKLGMADSALYYFEREKKFNPGRVKAYTNIASLHFVNARYADAINEVEQTLSQKPYDITANMLLLRATSAMPEIDDDSLAYLALCAAERTENDIYLLNEAAGLLVSRGNLSLAEPLLLQALSVRPPPIETDDEAFGINFRNSSLNWKKEQAKTNYQLGYIYGLQGRYYEATHHSCLAIEGDSSLVEAYINLISGYLSIGKRQKADSVLTIAIGKFPKNQYLVQLQDYFSQ